MALRGEAWLGMNLGLGITGSSRPVEGAEGQAPTTPAALTALVRAELVRTLFKQLPTVLAANLMCAGLIAYEVWEAVPRTPLMGWIVAMAVGTLGRLWLWYRVRPRPGSRCCWAVAPVPRWSLARRSVVHFGARLRSW